MKVPVLLRQYLALNAHIISFNIDPKFADCLDGFLVLDLEKYRRIYWRSWGRTFNRLL
jgi:hypothetical protein